MPSGPGFDFSGPVRVSKLKKIWSGFPPSVWVSFFVRSGPGFSFICFVYKVSFSLELSIGSVSELLVLKNAAECISKRLKWTSGARIMIIFGRPVARRSSLGCSVARSLALRSITRFRSLGRSAARSVPRSLALSLARSIARSLARALAR